MTPDAVWELPTRLIGRRVHVFDRLDSTNTLALSMTDDDSAEGLVLLAREQTSGRGQHGRTWLSPPDSSLLMSAIVEVPPALCRPVVLTAWAAVSVCRLIEDVAGVSPTIKWPNDILIDGRKVCGILIEMRGRAVVGIGLNVTQSAEDFRRAGLPEAVSLAMLGTTRSLESLARELCLHLDAGYIDLLEGSLDAIETPWRERLGLLDLEVIAECIDGLRRGTVAEVGFDVVRFEDGTRLRPESIVRMSG